MPRGNEIFKVGDTDLGQFADLGQLHERRWQWLEQAVGPAVALPTEYFDGYHVPQHRHSRSQLLHALVG
ncbi:MAG: AraC family transcriptional regulator, partial [Mesorhizobium sp.]